MSEDKFSLTQKELKEQLYYNPFSGLWRWRTKKGKHKRWEIAGGHHSHSDYHVIRVNDQLYKSHILAWVYMKGYFPENQIDHIDRNRQNNKWNNLREASQQCNSRNSGIGLNNTSGIKGVSWCKERSNWEAYITINSKRKNLGRYKNITEAAKTRWEAEVKYGWPICQTTSTAYLYLKGKGLLSE